jgi:ABC-type transport system involved in cytochrome c biogenesis permease subunit
VGLILLGTAVAAAVYAVGGTIAIRALFRAEPSPVRRIVVLTVAGFVAHTVALGIRAAEIGRCPSVTPFECVLLTAWILVGLYVLLGAALRVGFLGALVLPLAALLCGAALLMRKEPLADPDLMTSPWLGWHASFSLLGYASFALGFAVGGMYWLQQHQLARGKAGLVFLQFPSLPRLDRAQTLANAVGWGAFTIGLAAGFLWNRDLRGAWWNPDPKFIWSLLVWGSYGVVVLVALVRPGSGRRIVPISLLVFILAAVTFPLSNALSALHRF